MERNEWIVNVFLVDDEKGIVEGLKKMIARYIPECEVIGAAHNGVEGAALIMEKQPDIVLTDIRMPQADGLDMIQALKDQGCRSKFIILSGYADFEYARKGMQLGVQFYLNKPVEEDELRDCICQVMAAVREEQAKEREVDSLKQEVHSRLTESLLRDLMNAGGDPYDLEDELLRLIRTPKVNMKYVCALLDFDRNETNMMPIGDFKESGLEPVSSQIDQVLQHYDRVYRFRYSVSQLAVIVMQEGNVLAFDELQHSFYRLKEALHRELKLIVTIGIGTVQERAAGIGGSFEEARHALSKKKDVIAEIKDYVAAHYDEPISLAELSARFFLNPYYLSQLFKQKTGDTYLNYLARIRINKSKELLEKTDLKVYEICQKVGYTDTQYFSRLFEKLIGIKPSEYRKNLPRT